MVAMMIIMKGIGKTMTTITIGKMGKRKRVKKTVMHFVFKIY